MNNSSEANPSSVQIKLSEVISALSYALDITEGQPKGHAARSCMLGMRIAKELRFNAEQSSALFYALLLKDLGCSSNAGRMCYLFGSDDRTLKHDVKTVNWTSFPQQLGYAATHSGMQGSLLDKAKHFARVAIGGPKAAKEMIELRCDRGAKIARELSFPELTAGAIRSLDEHWDGHGHPDGLKGEEIPLLARILNLAQTVEVFIREYNLETACEMAAERSGTWFDPELVKLFLAVKNDGDFWQKFNSPSPSDATAAFEPPDSTLIADASLLDRIAEGFSQVIDAKSPWTYRHSEGVAKISAGIAQVMGFSDDEVRYVRRAALVHDVGKLGISNLILDKPGKLTPEELTEMRRHTFYTHQILSQVQGFKDLADLAAAHHEQLDGKGYHRGLDASQLSTSARILAVADIYEALTAKRPYRQDLTDEEVTSIMRKKLGWGICPEVYDALGVYLVRTGFTPMKLAA
jgi:putative nucleotidyltransferase with HDIG domain